MNTDMYGLIEKILWGVSFIAIGGAVAIMFFLIFAQSIIGSKTIHQQLERLLRQGEQINEQLKQITQHLTSASSVEPKKEKDNPQNES